MMLVDVVFDIAVVVANTDVLPVVSFIVVIVIVFGVDDVVLILLVDFATELSGDPIFLLALVLKS